MSESSSSGDNYEAKLSDASSTVAQFEDERRGPLHRIQHALHVTPSLVPLVLLLLSIAIFGIALGA